MEQEVVRGTKDFQVPEYFNFADVIDEWARKEKEGKRQSDTPALWWIDGNGHEVKWSFEDVAFNSKKTANVLSTAAGIKPGDRVIVMLPAIPEFWLIQAACLRTGGVFATLPCNLGPKELHRRILMSNAVCVVSANCDDISTELLDAVDQIAISGNVNFRIRSRILVNRIKDEQRVGWLSFEKLFEVASGDFQSVKSLSSAPCYIAFTSGTTGNSKMAEHSQASMGLGGTGMQIKRYEETDLSWTATNTGWSWIMLEGFFCSWSVGSSTFAHYKSQNVTIREMLETLQAYPITDAVFNNYKYVRALHEENLESFRFPRLKRCFLGGEPVNEHIVRDWKKRTGVELYNCYGGTEVNILTLVRDAEDHSLVESVGKLFPGVDMLIVDDNNQEVPHGTVGRAVIRVKPYRYVGLFTRYVDGPEKTAACYSGDFYVTGDVGHRDASGHFWIVGRADDVIIRHGLNINPVEVEKCLKEHPAVSDCAVIASPKPMGLKALNAFVVLSKEFKNNNKDKLVNELLDHVTYNTGEWMKPDKVEFIENIPKNIVGKIDRHQLKQRE